eukprot:TRINITY_DN31219_c0_g1_i1.p1 TRINITY_DN31219_c0_g1~~TRINITY_DN31219_c0_g1_i1.p1  ORF type:complete len:335 (-),score=32.94 TRINITY_DN31219_c0_g1_i1:354-1358(-)
MGFNSHRKRRPNLALLGCLFCMFSAGWKATKRAQVFAHHGVHPFACLPRSSQRRSQHDSPLVNCKHSVNMVLSSKRRQATNANQMRTCRRFIPVVIGAAIVTLGGVIYTCERDIQNKNFQAKEDRKYREARRQAEERSRQDRENREVKRRDEERRRDEEKRAMNIEQLAKFSTLTGWYFHPAVAVFSGFQLYKNFLDWKIAKTNCQDQKRSGSFGRSWKQYEKEALTCHKWNFWRKFSIDTLGWGCAHGGIEYGMCIGAAGGPFGIAFGAACGMAVPLLFAWGTKKAICTPPPIFTPPPPPTCTPPPVRRTLLTLSAGVTLICCCHLVRSLLSL